MNKVTLYGYKWRRGKLMEEQVECTKDGHFYNTTEGHRFTFVRGLRGMHDDKVGKVMTDALEGGYPLIYLQTPNRNRAVKRLKEHYNKLYQDAKAKCISAEDNIKALNYLYEVEKDA